MPQSKSNSLTTAPDPGTRSPYVVKACQECRRRKIKCNGGRPCRRCDRLLLGCFYRAKRQHNSQPESMDLPTLLAELNTLRAENEMLANSSGRGSSESDSPQSTLQQREAVTSHHEKLLDKACPSEPLDVIPSDEMERLITVFDKHLHFQYPLADMDSIVESAAVLRQNRNAETLQRGIEEADAASLRLVLANGMAVDDRCHGDLPVKLYESTQPYLSGLPEVDRLDIKALRAIVLVASYYMIRDKVVAAWRNIGFAVRTAVELGLYLQRNVEKMFPSPQQQRSIRELYWCIYVLDHCWSLHMGFGPAMKDVDPEIGIAEPDDTMPFLRAMVDCTKIISRSWKVISPSVNEIHDVSLRTAQERLEDVYRELREWQTSSAVSAYYYSQQSSLDEWQSTCLKTFLYLRANELCIFLCKPILVTRNSLAENRGTLEFATTLAKDSISVLIEFQRSCSGMRVLPFVFNQFLSSALASLLLAIIQEPHRYITREGDCRPPIMAVKELVEDLERGSFISRKLYGIMREDFAYLHQCRILGRDPETTYYDNPEPTTQEEFDNALRYIEPLFGRVGHSM